MQAIKITPAFAILLQTNSWVIINQDYAVGAYKSRQAARDAKALDNLEGSIKNKTEVEFEIVMPVTETAVTLGKPLTDPTEASNQPKVEEKKSEPLNLGAALKAQHAGATAVRITESVDAKDARKAKEARETEKAPKLPKAKLPKASAGPILHKSEIDHPCKRVWGIASDMKAANPNIKRGEVLAACVAQGIAYYTARTQYQQWLGIQKEMADREAAQAAQAAAKV